MHLNFKQVQMQTKGKTPLRLIIKVLLQERDHSRDTSMALVLGLRKAVKQGLDAES